MIEQRLIVCLLLVLSAFFSASEIAIMSSPLYKIKQLVGNGHKKIGNLLLSLRKNSQRTLITILIGNNLVNVILSIYASKIGDKILQNLAISGAIGFFLVSFFITVLILFFGEIVPKVISTKYSLKIAMFVAPIINTISYLLYPAIVFFEFFINILNKILVTNEDKVSKDDVEVFVEDGKKQGIFTDTESLIIKNLLVFDERSVDSIITHRTEVFALPSDITLSEAIKKVIMKPYSRIPIYQGDKDNILGILTLRDFLVLSIDPQNLTKKLKDFKLRNVFKLPFTASLLDVFLQMKKEGYHFAVVYDQYGGTAGIITFEDVLEDLIGDIKDEKDINEEDNFVKINDKEYIVKGNVLLRDVLNLFNLDNFDIPIELEDDISQEDMVSFVILTMLQTFAKKGDTVSIGNLLFEVIETNKTEDKILKVKVKLISDSNDQ